MGLEFVALDVEVQALEGQPLAADERLDHAQPFALIGIALVMLGETDAGLFQFWPVPGIDQIGGEAAAADVLDLQCHLGENDRVIEIRLDRRDDLDGVRQARERRRRRPRLELVPVRIVRIDRMLGDKRRIVA
jgi:hypothetical protein